MKLSVVLTAFLVILPAWAFGETHDAVQTALDYELPENTCSKPKVISNEATVTAPPQDPSSTAFFEGSSTSEVSDVDGYTRKRQERKETRWKKCVVEYKEGLLQDMEQLKGSAQHGLTQEQANTILESMALIQKVYMTPDGVLEEAERTEP